MMRRVMKVLRTFFQPLEYISKKRASSRSRSKSSSFENSPSPTLQLPQISVSRSKSNAALSSLPVIAIRRARSLNRSKPSNNCFSKSDSSLSTNYNNRNNENFNNNYLSANLKSKSEIPRIVAEVIGEATAANSRRKVERQIVRIINGTDPSVQSQVLLNTQTNQPWEDLVRDLATSVRLGGGDRLETLYGRPIQSYSQLRSELKVGSSTFYIYAQEELYYRRLSFTPDLPSLNTNYRVKRSRSNVHDRPTFYKSPLSKTYSNSSSELSFNSKYLEVPGGFGQHTEARSQRRRRRSHAATNSPNSSSLQLPAIQSNERLVNRTRRRKSSSVSPIPRSKSQMETRSVHFQN